MNKFYKIFKTGNDCYIVGIYDAAGGLLDKSPPFDESEYAKFWIAEHHDGAINMEDI